MKTAELDIKEGENIPWLKNLSACLEKLKSDGYTEDFRATKNGLSTYNNSKSYKPEDIKIDNFYRFEGVSDPGDTTVLYAMQTSDGIKGTLSDGYGPYADENVAKFIVHVEEIHKQIHSSGK